MSAHQLRVLVIDDDSLTRGVVRRALERESMIVTEAPNGRAGVELCRHAKFDVVVTDIFMPEKDGFEVILELRAIHPDTPLIAVSGGATTVDLDLLNDAHLIGARHVLAKPFAMSALLAAIRGVIRLTA